MDAVHGCLKNDSTKYNVQVLAITIDDARGAYKSSRIGCKVKVGSLLCYLMESKIAASPWFQTVPQNYLLNAKVK